MQAHRRPRMLGTQAVALRLVQAAPSTPPAGIKHRRSRRKQSLEVVQVGTPRAESAEQGLQVAQAGTPLAEQRLGVVQAGTPLAEQRRRPRWSGPALVPNSPPAAAAAAAAAGKALTRWTRMTRSEKDARNERRGGMRHNETASRKRPAGTRTSECHDMRLQHVSGNLECQAAYGQAHNGKIAVVGVVACWRSSAQNGTDSRIWSCCPFWRIVYGASVFHFFVCWFCLVCTDLLGRL